MKLFYFYTLNGLQVYDYKTLIYANLVALKDIIQIVTQISPSGEYSYENVNIFFNKVYPKSTNMAVWCGLRILKRRGILCVRDVCDQDIIYLLLCHMFCVCNQSQLICPVFFFGYFTFQIIIYNLSNRLSMAIWRFDWIWTH